MFKQYKFGKEMTAYNRNLLSMLKLQINRSLQFLLLVLSTDVRYSEDQKRQRIMYWFQFKIY